MRRILALVLSVVMVLALPVMGFAAGSSASSRSSGGGSSTPTEGTTTTTLSDGTKVETTTAADGTVTTTTTKPDGEQSVDADVPSSAASNAAKESRSVVIDAKVNAVPAAEEAKAAPVKVSVPGSAGKTKVEVTVANLSNGVVAAQVKEDGTTEIVKTSTVGEKGVVFNTQGSATYNFLINNKDFTDLTASWQKAGADFASSRELMLGTGANTFSPDDPMTPAMMATILARLGGEVSTEDSTGEGWADEALKWAAANYNVANPDQASSREAMMVMLYKFAGSPEVTGDLSAYSDASAVSGEAKDAVTWCVANGIILGTSGTTLAPTGTATRAQFATVLMRYCELLNK